MPSDEFEQMFQTYLAGLKAGKDMNVVTKWHKVADGDLPDNTDNVLSDKGVIVYYNFTYACWVDDVIAWCEKPGFEGVEK